jgi:glycosyltransferase involved in cell wall biosynthesis
MGFNSAPVYVDARCLQDPLYQFRGVGHHVSALLRNRSTGAAKNFRAIGLVDPSLPGLPVEYKQLFDSVGLCLNYSLPRRGSIFISPSPMTHDPRFTLRFLGHEHLLNAAIVHDFIPFDWPGYLTNVSNRIDYLSKLAWLKTSTLFLPNSHYTAKRLTEMLGVDGGNIRVTGCSVRSCLFEFAQLPTAHFAGESRPYFLTVAGGDRRKNAETVVRAVRLLNPHLQRKVKLRIVGHYSPDYKADLERLADGPDDFLEFCPGVDDRTLVALYTGALATIVPSHIEGFSIPVVEAAICGCPVIASSCAAHLELINSRDALFSSDSVEQLTQRLSLIIADQSFRERLISAQAPLAQNYHEESVGKRFWNFIVERFENHFPRKAPSLSRRARPRVAVLSPFPPDQSGVARFTELTLQAARKWFDIDLFTNAPRPIHLPGGVRDLGHIGVHALLKSRYDSILSVIGNSHFHTPIFELFERYGGPCILHDSRLTQIYFDRLGEQEFMKFAAKRLGRSVSMDDVRFWLQDQQLPSLFIEPVIERAEPLIVHTRAYRELLQKRYGINAHVATFPPNMWFEQEELAGPSRSAIRNSLEISDNTFVISSFGFLSRSKGVFACIAALDLLRSWDIPAELFLIGEPLGLDSAVQQAASNFGVSEHVHLTKGFVPAERYRNFMIASDAAIQLRTYGLGQPSAGLVDCISAGLPSVSGCSLADACDAPSYVFRIPDNISALLLAERLAECYEAHLSRRDTEEERILYCRQHSFEYYAERLTEILNI